MKPSWLKEHLSKIHYDKLEKPLSFFQDLKAKIEKRVTVNSLFKKQSSDLDKGLIASYKVSLLIAKNYPFSFELVKISNHIYNWNLSILNPTIRLKLLSCYFSPSTYLAEKGFSVFVQLLTKQRNQLDICNKGDQRLTLTNIESDIAKLAATHQAQGSH
ncbi:Ubiquitin-conjugating enzyme/RWD-like [Cinara cedri]|uniref:Ubiquitin-conjugating enzyme/RWD-like n=1 Tax=Cinara cedri TaxID=506608 RepID=A0A5E4NN56_9HEMI|nr:Ubiquitin-conjugating enzyme/RWD-like [Cinara cedri]